jgi:glucose-6-phosphate isomerase
MAAFAPVNVTYSIDPASFEPNDLVIERTLKDMGDAYYDQEAVSKRLEKDNPTIIKVWMAPLPDKGGHLMPCMTVIYPGKVGDEYYMTKGHFHIDPESAPEVYITLKGQGKLLLQTREGQVHVSDMVPGQLNYIPSEWAHRTVNTGDEEFVFLGVFPAAAERDYSFIGVGKENFHKIVVERNGRPEVIDRPNPAKKEGNRGR